jgi:sugar phosphate isomerase/epimerase
MRLGIVGLIPSDFTTFDDEQARHIRAMGFSGVAAHVAGDPFAAQEKALRHLRAVLDANGLRLVQFWGGYPSLVTGDDSIRQQGVAAAREIVRLGAFMRADMVGIRPTSMSPNGAWSPDAANYLPATEDRLVDSLRQIAAACADHVMPMALECHVTTTLSSPPIVRRVIERVGSHWVRVNLDPVNFVRDHQTVYDTTGLLDELFDTLGEYIAAVHIKDVKVEDNHVVHISETPPGTGLLDFDTLFRRFEGLLPDGYALIEHLSPEQIPAAAAFVQRKLRDLQITVKDD